MFKVSHLLRAAIGLGLLGLSGMAFADLQALHVPGKGEGHFPAGGVTAASNGILYGIVQNSSTGPRYNLARGCGLVFRIDARGRYRTLLDFNDLKYSEGCRVAGALLLDNGYLYGLTYDVGPDRHGTLFRLSRSGGHELIHVFNGTDGSLPVGGLSRGADGKLYGVTQEGGQHGAGTVFRVDRGGQLETLHHFQDDTPLGADTIQPLTLGPDGAMYGTSKTNIVGKGAVYRVTTSGVIELVRSLSTAEGCYPSGLSLGSDGWLYGAAMLCGRHGLGTLYRVHPDGRLHTLHHFNGEDGSGPRDRPTQGPDGAWYGTTIGYLEGSAGTLYRFQPGATEAMEVLHRFNLAVEDGVDPVGPVLPGADGALYGTTQQGGNTKGPLGTGPGMVYRFPPAQER